MPKVTKKEVVDWDWVKHVAANIREPERKDFLRHFDTVEEGILHGASVSRRATTVFLDDEPVAIFGVSNQDGAKVPWLALTKSVMDHPYLVVKHARMWFEEQCRGKPFFFTNVVPCEDDAAVRFIEAIGFTIDFEVIREMNGGDYYPFWYDGRLE